MYIKFCSNYKNDVKLN